MLRITRVEREGNGNQEALALRVEGQVLGESVAILAAECTSLLERGCALALDLDGVGYLDREGLALVRSLGARGVEIEGCSSLVRTLLERPVGAATAADLNVASQDEPSEAEALRRNLSVVLRAARVLFRNEERASAAVVDAYRRANARCDEPGIDAVLQQLCRIAVEDGARNGTSGAPLPSGPRLSDRGWLESEAPANQPSATAASEPEALRRRARALPVGQRMALLLSAAGLGLEQISAALAVSVKEARRRLHEARVTLCAGPSWSGAA